MKKYLVSGLLVLSVLIPVAVFAQTDTDPNPNTSDCVSITNNLRYRSRDINTGGDVSALQDFLQSENYLNSGPTGYFGLLTTRAVKSFQTANSISPTGYVGPLTRAKIYSSSCGAGAVVTPIPVPVPVPQPPQPPPPPVPPITVTVQSPNGGETWVKGTTQNIRWQDVNDISTHEVKLIPYYQCGNGTPCIPHAYFSYTIANTQGSSYNWNVGGIWNSKTDLVPDGSYTVQVCQTGTSNCDSSDSYFKIISSPTLTPTITSISPSSGATGTKVTLYGRGFITHYCATNTCATYNTVKFGSNATISYLYSDDGTSLSFTVPSSNDIPFMGAMATMITPGAYQVYVANPNGTSNSINFTVTDQNNPPKITGFPVVPPSMNVGQSYAFAWSATDADNDNLSWTIDWGDGTGFTMPCPSPNPNNSFAGSHIWLAPGSFVVKVLASDCKGGTADNSLTVNVVSNTSNDLVIKTTDLGLAFGGTDFAATINASGGTSSYSWAVTAGQLPPGLSLLNAACFASPCQIPGGISGNPTAYGSYPFTITLTSGKQKVSKDFTIFVGSYNPPPPPQPPPPPPSFSGPAGPTGYTFCAYEYGTCSFTGTKSVAYGYSPDFIYKNFTNGTACNNDVFGSDPHYGAGKFCYISSSSVLGAEFFQFTQSLKEGSQGHEVVELQKFLNNLGYNSGGVDGIFGPNLKAALIKFQIANKLTPDGVVGPEVRAVLNK